MRGTSHEKKQGKLGRLCQHLSIIARSREIMVKGDTLTYHENIGKDLFLIIPYAVASLLITVVSVLRDYFTLVDPLSYVINSLWLTLCQS